MDNRDWLEKRKNIRVLLSSQIRIKLIDKDLAKSIRLQENSISQVKTDIFSQNGSILTEKKPTPIRFLSDLSASLNDQASPTISYLMDSIVLLNDKLDRIIDILEGNKEENRITVKETVNISGTGIKLLLYDPVEEGQLLDISLNIPKFPLGKFNAFGEVVRSKKLKKKSEKDIYEVGIEFINIHEEARERLIAYAFSEQRQKIRQLKENRISDSTSS